MCAFCCWEYLYPEWISDLHRTTYKVNHFAFTHLVTTVTHAVTTSHLDSFLFQPLSASVSCSIDVFQPSSLTAAQLIFGRVIYIRLKDYKVPIFIQCHHNFILCLIQLNPCHEKSCMTSISILIQFHCSSNHKWKCWHGIVCFVNEDVFHLLSQLVCFGLTSFNLGLIHHVVCG